MNHIYFALNVLWRILIFIKPDETDENNYENSHPGPSSLHNNLINKEI